MTIQNERDLLEHSFLTVRELKDDQMSRLVFLADHIFAFTTYDDEMGELFASKALEVCAAISNGSALKYIGEGDNYRWFLLMVNMPFFAGRLDWGTSVRGAFWAAADQTLESDGLWEDGKQLLAVTLGRDDWLHFVAAMVAFAMGVDACQANTPQASQPDGR